MEFLRLSAGILLEMHALPAHSSIALGSEITLPCNGTHKFLKLLLAQCAERRRIIVQLNIELTNTYEVLCLSRAQHRSIDIWPVQDVPFSTSPRTASSPASSACWALPTKISRGFSMSPSAPHRRQLDRDHPRVRRCSEAGPRCRRCRRRPE